MKKKNYTLMFYFLFLSSIMGGLALKDVFHYSMMVGSGVGIIFLFCSAYFAEKRQRNIKSQK